MKTSFTYEELDERARQTAREEYVRDCVDADSSWCEYLTDERRGVQALARGFHIDSIYWSGFCSQGDGACWKGDIRVDRWVAWKIKQHEDKGEAPPVWMLVLQTLCDEGDVECVARVTVNGHHCSHSGTMSLLWDGLACMDDVCVSEGIFAGANSCTLWADVVDQDRVEEMLLQEARDYADETYRMLEEEYDYCCSEETVEENIKANDWRFDEDGHFQS